MGFEAIPNDSEDRKGLGAGSERDDVPSLGSSLSSQGEVGGPLRVGSWGRDYVKGAQMSSPWTQQAWDSQLGFELGSARVKLCLGTLVWLLYCLSRSSVIETNPSRKSCHTESLGQSGPAFSLCPFTCLAWALCF